MSSGELRVESEQADFRDKGILGTIILHKTLWLKNELLRYSNCKRFRFFLICFYFPDSFALAIHGLETREFV
jgi:hypothetical protein